jgi:hypothetical protein
MFKTYGASKDLSYKFHNLLTEEIEKRKDENDSDKLISENNINDLTKNNTLNYFHKNTLPGYIIKYKNNIDNLRKLKIKCN